MSWPGQRDEGSQNHDEDDVAGRGRWRFVPPAGSGSRGGDRRRRLRRIGAGLARGPQPIGDRRDFVRGGSGRDSGRARFGAASVAHVARYDVRAAPTESAVCGGAGRRALLVRRRTATPGPGAGPASHRPLRRSRSGAFRLRRGEAVAEVVRDENGRCGDIPGGSRPLRRGGLGVRGAAPPGRALGPRGSAQRRVQLRRHIGTARPRGRAPRRARRGRPARRPGRRRAAVPGLCAHGQRARGLPGAGGRGAAGRTGPPGGADQDRSRKTLVRRPGACGEAARLR